MQSQAMLKGLERVINAAAIAAGYACLGLCFLIGYEIVARRLLSHSVQGVDEIGGYVLALTAAIGFASALLHSMHTRIDIALTRFPRPVQAILNMIAAALLAGFAIFMLLRGWDALQESLEFGSRASTPLQTPLWIPQSLWVTGIGLFAAIATAMAIHSVILLLRGRADDVNNTYGPPSLADEVNEQLAETERMLEEEGRK